MSDVTLIRLHFDPYSALVEIGNQATMVTDLSSYAAARRAIEELKAGERAAPLTIVVRSRHFLSGFHDLPLLGNWVQVTDIAPRNEIAKAFHLQLPPDLADTDLIAVGVRGPDDLLATADAQGIYDQTSLEDALLAKAFGAPVFRSAELADVGAWLKDLMGFLHSREAATSVAWKVKPIRNLAEERIKSALERSSRLDLLAFISDLVDKSSCGESQAYLNQLAVRCWLKNYRRLARKAVIDNMPDQAGRWQEMQGETLVLDSLAPWCEELYKGDSALHERLEEVLSLLLEQGDLIEEEDPIRFIQQTSGRFVAEYDAAQSRFGKLLMTAITSGVTKDHRVRVSTYSGQLSDHFAPLLQRTGRQLKQEPWVASLLEFSDVIHHLAEASPVQWADWLATYELLIKAKHLDRSLQSTLPAPYQEQLGDFSARFSTLNERLNSAFGDWAFKAYPGLVACTVDQPPLVMHAARLALDSVARKARVIFLVLDALDWELWQHLRGVLGKKGFIVEGSEAGMAMLPSITEFSRRAIFAGLSPRSLATFVDDIYGTEIPPQEEAKTLARALGYLGRIGQLRPLPTNRRIQYLEGDLVYARGSEIDLRQALDLDAKCYALVYTEIDAHIHVSKLEEPQLKAAMRQWLTDLAGEIIQGIRQNRVLREETSLKIIIASDHGFLDVSRQSQIALDPSLRAFLDLERHGRLAVVRVKEGGEQTPTALQLAKEFCGEHSLAWRTIWREQAAAFGLAESSASEGEVIAWLMPQLLGYVSKGTGEYVHGGLSMYEMIVPLAVLTRGEVGIEAPVVTLTGRMSSEEESMLSIAVLNKNDRPLQGLVIGISELSLAGLQVGDMGPGDVAKLDVPVTPLKSGDLAIHVILEGEISGIRKQFSEVRILTVEPGRRERMRRSTRRTFDDE